MRQIQAVISAEELRRRLNIRNGNDSTVPGPQGIPGLPGEQGPQGDIPAHRWQGTKLQFQNPDKSWGELVDLRGKEGKGKKGGGGGTSKGIFYHDLTAQCNDVLKVFTIPANTRVLGVFGTQFPQNYRPEVDWTGSGTTTLTLTDQVGAPQTGQTLYIQYVEA